MADPLRRTLLAKLRGKKSKKRTAVGEFGAGNTEDNRDGKDEVLFKSQWKVKQSRVVADFNVFSDTMRSNEICTDCAPESGGIGSICENVEVKNTPAQHEIFAQMNTSLCKCGEDFEFSGRVNEGPFGVSVQSQPQTTGRDRVEKPRFNEKLNVLGDVTTGSFGRSQEQKHQPVTPLLVSADSTGLGVFENPDLNRGRLCGGIGSLKLTDGPAFISECNGSSVGCKKDLTTRSGTCDICQQAEPNHDFDEPFIEGKYSLLSDISKMSEANIWFTGTERCSFDVSNEIFKINAICTNETGLIKQEEGNANHPGQKQTEYQVSNFQRSPTGSEERDLDIGGRPPSCKNGKRGQNSVDAEYDDYYDNGNVLLNECEVRITEENDGESFNHCGMKYTLRSQTNESTIHEDETARLRTQFKEAYFLLINAMHNISSDCQVGGSGFGSQMNPSSCQSHERVALAKVISGHAWSPGDKVPQQVSGTDSMPFNGSKNSSPCLKIPLISKSFENLPSSKRSPLHRSASDGAIRYHQTHSLGVESPFAQACTGKNGDWGKSNRIAEKDRLKGLFARDDKSMENQPQENGGEGQLNNSSGSDGSFNCLPDSAKTQGDKQNFKAAQDAFAKPHGVTVNRIQGWMHKGRLLSSEMKQRITGSPPATRGSSSSHSCHRTKAAAPMVRLQGSQSVAHSQSALQSGLAEDVHGSTAAPKQPRVGKCKATSEWPQPPNTITVSKKRNWLQQSAKRGHAPEDCLNFTGGEKDRGLVSNPSVPAPGAGRMTVRHLARVSGGHPRAVDQAEENDADDEGEIWYNPIPEDEDPRLGGTLEAQDSPGGVAGRTNAARSQEPTEPRRPVLVCKAVEETLAPRSSAPDGNDSPGAGLSPPSSPNLFKKGSSINWSFPDRIRSPRTVRKLSMQMKKLPELSRKLSVKGTPQVRPRLPPGAGQVAASRNVISRYHLDSSVSTRQGSSKSASKGGYLSDGDSPELVAKAGKAAKSKDQTPASGGPKLQGAEVDTDAFRLYSFAGQPKCAQYISGLMSLHFYGAEDLKPPRADSRDVYCAIQVDSVNKARTALLTCRTGFLDMDHTFNIELENAQHLKLAVFSWEATPRRHRVCCHGSVALPTLFRVTRTHRLAVRLEPRGTIYVKLSLMERWQNWLERPGGGGGGGGEREPQVFGVDASWVVERESTGLMVPLVVEKCIAEIERRGCQVVGLYRLCGSAAVKKELREAFERDSRAVELTEDQFPDVNVITGVLKDYLRELPNPLINQQLYEAVLDAMAKRPLRIGPSGCENDRADSQHAVGLLANLPQVEKETLHVLLDHLRLVASHHEENKMTCQNLAVCFGPVLLSQRQEASCHSNRVFAHSEELASALHFKKHIEVLHYLLQLWPVVDPHGRNPALKKGPPAGTPAASQCLLRRKERPQTLKGREVSGLLRPRPGRLDSPSNRYAGDWSRCRESYFQPPRKSPREEADYDDVPWEDRGSAEDGQGGQEPDLPVLEVTGGQEDQGEESVMEEEEEEEEETTVLPEDSTNHILLTQKHLAKENTYQAYMKIQEINPVLSNRVNLNDLQQSIDTLIGNLERELNKNKLNIGY